MTTTRPALAIALLHLAAISSCGLDSGNHPQPVSLAAFDPAGSLSIESKIGDTTSKEIAVSGRERLEVPDTRNWACGTPLRGTTMSNVAWLELGNPSSDTLSVSLELEGLTETHPKLFVYGSKNTPLANCLTFSGERKLAGTSSVVVEPTSYAAILLATGTATGVYTLAIKTDHVIPP
jgi:hypothetical protein